MVPDPAPVEGDGLVAQAQGPRVGAELLVVPRALHLLGLGQAIAEVRRALHELARLPEHASDPASVHEPLADEARVDGRVGRGEGQVEVDLRARQVGEPELHEQGELRRVFDAEQLALVAKAPAFEGRDDLAGETPGAQHVALLLRRRAEGVHHAQAPVGERDRDEPVGDVDRRGDADADEAAPSAGVVEEHVEVRFVPVPVVVRGMNPFVACLHHHRATAPFGRAERPSCASISATMRSTASKTPRCVHSAARSR